jgi:eukaryotic translation initiation factor 2-alpha kinase 4
MRFSEEEVDDTLTRLDKVSHSTAALMQSACQEVRDTIKFAHAAGVGRQIFFHPLMLGSHHTHFKDGIIVEVVKRNKHTDILAAGGR